MAAHEEAGHAVVCVSATFEPIIAAAMERRPIQYAIATRMRVDFQGNYTDEVEGRAHRGPREGGGAPSPVRRAVRRGRLGARLGLRRSSFR